MGESMLEKCQGGLGLANLRRTNEILLQKWLWKWFSETNKPWRKIIDGLKQGQHHSEYSYMIRNVTGIQLNQQVLNLLSLKNYVWKTGDSKFALFWEDNWHTSSP